MDETGSSPGGPAVSNLPAKQRYTPEDPLIVERRRKEIARLRYVEHKTEREIAGELGKLDPPIKISQSTISRDLHLIRKHFRHYLSVKGFDPASEVYAHLAAFEERANLCMKKARDEAVDGKTRAALVRAANDCSRSAIDLLQDVGLLDRRLGTLIVDSGDRTSERVPSGLELQKQFDAVNVIDAEIVSEAELAWRYGDAAAAESAAKAATDSTREREQE